MAARQTPFEASFAAEAVAALHPDAGAAPRHRLAYRVSLPVPLLGQHYVSIAIGREARSGKRITREGQTRLSRSIVAIGVVLTLAFGLFCGLYLAKSFAGINILPGPSPLHQLYLLFHG